MKLKASLIVLMLFNMSAVVVAEPQNKQCELIAGLTGDYYAQRLEGKTQQDLEQDTPAEFANLDFLRTIDLAINLAFSMPDDKTEQEVEETVYGTCLQHQTR
jgi:hypothetical protein